VNADTRLTTRQKIEQGVAAWDRNAYSDALAIFSEVIKEQPHFPDVHNRAGLCKGMLGDLEGALDEFEKALELAPTYAEAHFNRAIVMNELGRHEEAAQSFRRAQELDTRDGTRFPSQVGNQIAAAHSQLGDLYMVAESPASAVQQYRTALEVRPRFLDVREKLAEALLADGDSEGARRELERVLDEEPGFVDARLRLGVALQRLGDLDGAVREWKRVIQLRPDDRRVHAYLASAGASQEGVTPQR
jgi:tetratricopeptide (TPR) repeat protein